MSFAIKEKYNAHARTTSLTYDSPEQPTNPELARPFSPSHNPPTVATTCVSHVTPSPLHRASPSHHGGPQRRRQQQRQQQQRPQPESAESSRATCLCVSAFAGDDNDGGLASPSSGAAGCVTRYANRRRTDLMPTIPSPRDGSVGFNPPGSSGRSSSAKSFTRSPGRTYSMSRLDQLAQPRKRLLPGATASAVEPMAQQLQQLHASLAASSMSRSMSHLARGGAAKHQPQQQQQHAHAHALQLPLKRTDNSRSMGTLPGAGSGLGGPGLGLLLSQATLAAVVAQPRPTRAERLRRKAREHQQQQPMSSGKDTTLRARRHDRHMCFIPSLGAGGAPRRRGVVSACIFLVWRVDVGSS